MCPSDCRIPMDNEGVSEFLAREPISDLSNLYCRWWSCQSSLLCLSPRQKLCGACCATVSRFGYRRGFFDRRNLRRFFKKLSDSFLLSVCFLSLVRLPVTMSTPISSGSSSRSHSPPRPHWTLPCGGPVEPNADYDLDRLPERDRFEVILLQAQFSLQEAHEFRDEYVNRTFNRRFQKHHDMWRRNHFSWLPSRDELPKEMGEQLPEEHLRSQDINEAYRAIHTFLQRIAIGMEQIEVDQRGSEFYDNFRQCNVNLNQLLCEVQIGMAERGILPPENISSSIMNYDVRGLHGSNRDYRDWLIFREYMNVLEYIVQLFEFLVEQTPS